MNGAAHSAASWQFSALTSSLWRSDFRAAGNNGYVLSNSHGSVIQVIELPAARGVLDIERAGEP